MSILNRFKHDARRGTRKTEGTFRRWQSRRRARTAHPNRNPRY